MSQQNQMSDRAFVGISLVAVVAAAITGFWLLGSPNQQRLISLDRERTSDIQAIAFDLLSATQNNIGTETQKQPLPERLPDALIGRSDRRDPLTGEPYEYRRIDADAYELCATFATDSAASSQRSPVNSPDDNVWPHPAGRHCFKILKDSAQPYVLLK